MIQFHQMGHNIRIFGEIYESKNLKNCQQNRIIYVLFILYQFVKSFWRLSFYCFFRTETFKMCVNVCNTTRNEISAGSNKKQRISTPIIKIVHFCNVMSIDMTLQKWALYIKGVYGEISHFR